MAALKDRAHTDAYLDHNTLWRERLTEELSALGLRVTPSVGNFLLLHFPSGERYQSRFGADKADEYLSARGFSLRRVTAYGFPNAIRMTIGTEEANLGVINALTEFQKD